MKRNILFTCVCILLLIAHCNQGHINSASIPPIPPQEEFQPLELSDSLLIANPDSIRLAIYDSYTLENYFQYTQNTPFSSSLL